MISRRKFIINGSLVAGAALLDTENLVAGSQVTSPGNPTLPLIMSTWDFGRTANAVASQAIKAGGNALDAVEKGINAIEADPLNTTVGRGGFPDRDGYVTLDASIMDCNGKAGSVTFLQNILHPISVARRVMEDTPHVMLSGTGAYQFALEKGFQKSDLLTDKARKAWEEWKVESHYKPLINIENHDTIGLLAMDQNGNISGGCSTSGLAFKMHGRVGDSPIIGAGLYVDNEVGAAVATGLGELIMRSVGAFLAVELIRNGKSPQEACEVVIQRIVRGNQNYKDFQVAIIAFDKSGHTGAYAIQPGFSYALTTGSTAEVFPSFSYL